MYLKQFEKNNINKKKLFLKILIIKNYKIFFIYKKLN